jgi:hypothetical protein
LKEKSLQAFREKSFTLIFQKASFVKNSLASTPKKKRLLIFISTKNGFVSCFAMVKDENSLNWETRQKDLLLSLSFMLDVLHRFFPKSL